MISPPSKFTNAKAPPPQLKLNLVMSGGTGKRKGTSTVSSPRDDFTPYMAGLLSPNDLGSDPASPLGEQVTLTSNGTGAGADLDYTSKGIKVVSFGQSRCDSSQKGGPSMVLNASASLGGHEGIMTFGNFASLLDEN